MSNLKKLTFLSVIALLVFSLILSGCVPTKNKSSNNNSSGNEDGDGPIEVTIFTPKLGSDDDFSHNEFTKEMEEKLNIKIKWEYANQDAAQEKRSLSLASGDYPDAFWLVTWIDPITKVEAQKYGKEGVLLPLNDLIKEHAPNIQKAMEDVSYLEAGITAPDGNIYGLPLLGECYHCAKYGKMWLNTDWLDKLGLEMPTTTEEFADVLRAFKNEDPNGNGKADEVPLSGESKSFENDVMTFLMNPFLPNNGKDFINVKDGKLTLAAMQPEWKDGLEYMHSLYEEGLLDQGAFTQNAEAYKQLGTPDGEQILGAGAALHPAVFADLQSEYSKSYEVVPPLEGPDGEQFTPTNYGYVNNFAFAITDKAKGKKAEALIKLADYFYTEEGALTATYGKEGVNWKEGGSDDIDLTGEQAKYVPIRHDEDEDVEQYGWGERGPLLQTREFRDSIGTSTEELSPEGYERRLYNATLKYDGFEPKESFNAEAAWVSPEEAEELNLIQLNIINYVKENSVQFITGSKDIEKEWDNYIKGFDPLQVDRYLEIYQKAYDIDKE